MSISQRFAENRLAIGWALLAGSWATWLTPEPFFTTIGLISGAVMLFTIVQNWSDVDLGSKITAYNNADKLLLFLAVVTFLGILFYRYVQNGTRDVAPAIFGIASILNLPKLATSVRADEVQ